jgi:hypothetical protein
VPPGRAVAREQLAEVALDGVAVVGMDPLAPPLDGGADGAGPVAEQLPEAVTPPHGPGLQVPVPHDVVGGVRDDLEAELARPERLLRALVVADVPHVADEMQGVAAGAADEGGAQLGPDEVPVLVDVALLLAEGLDLAGGHAGHEGAAAVEVPRVGDLGVVGAEQLALGAAEHLAEGPVHLEEPAVERDERHAHDGVVERGPEVLVALAVGRVVHVAGLVSLHRSVLPVLIGA